MAPQSSPPLDGSPPLDADINHSVDLVIAAYTAGWMPWKKFEMYIDAVLRARSFAELQAIVPWPAPEGVAVEGAPPEEVSEPAAIAPRSAPAPSPALDALRARHRWRVAARIGAVAAGVAALAVGGVVTASSHRLALPSLPFGAHHSRTKTAAARRAPDRPEQPLRQVAATREDFGTIAVPASCGPTRSQTAGADPSRHYYLLLPDDVGGCVRAAGLSLSAAPSTASSAHVHLDLRLAGAAVEVPAGIGVDLADGTRSAIVTTSAGGVVAFAPGPTPPTLGQLFSEWGHPLTPDAVGTLLVRTTWYVNGNEVADPAAVVLHDHDEIYGVDTAGASAAVPSSYNWPSAP